MKRKMKVFLGRSEVLSANRCCQYLNTISILSTHAVYTNILTSTILALLLVPFKNCSPKLMFIAPPPTARLNLLPCEQHLQNCSESHFMSILPFDLCETNVISL